MRRRVRDIRKMVEAEGLELIDLWGGGKHYRARLQNAKGAVAVHSFAMTPSCSHGDRNKVSQLRRFAKKEP